MKNMDEALDWLYSNRSKVKDIHLNRISFILNDLNLMPSYKVVLISGTNGKGSTASLLSNILVNKGYKVGLFTSPFILTFNERIKINNLDISDLDILKYLNFLKDYSENIYKDTIPFFELCLLMSLLYFKDNNIDIGLFECGIGGRYDATNALRPDLSIITSIGYDHTNTLGNSLDEILYHKIGIGRAFKPLVLSLDESIFNLDKYRLDDKINIINIYNEISDIKSSEDTSFKYKDKELKTSLRGTYQASNASLAIEAARILDEGISDSLIEASLDIKMPGRYEVISNKPLIILDGAHNISAIKELINNLKGYNKKITFIFSSLADKDYKGMLKILDSIADKFIFTYINDLRALEPNIFKNLVSKPTVIYNSISDIIKNLDINSDEMVVACGSLHFISQFLEKFNNMKK